MNPPRDTPAARTLPMLLLAGLGVCMPGCYGTLNDLDREVAEMIAERQRLALGEQGVSGANAAMPSSADGVSDPYAEQPVTFNPPAEGLPARAAGEDDPVSDLHQNAADLEAIELDLEGLLAYAIENAPEYRSEKESLFLATLSLIIERHQWGPRFFNTLSADISGVPESGDYDTALDLVNDFTVTQRLPYGGDVSVSALVNYTNLIQRASVPTQAEEIQDASISASFNLPLLRGAGQVAREDLIQAERDLIYAARAFERFRREFFVDISNTYFGLLRQQQGIVNQELQIESLKNLRAELRDKLRAGRVAGFEVQDAEAQVLFGESDLVDAVDRYATALDALKLRIGMPVSQDLAISPVEIDVPRPALDVRQAIRIGQAARLDLQTTADEVDDAKRGVRVAKNQLRGDLNLNASADLRTDSAEDIGGLDFDAGDSDYRVGFSYSPPLDRKIELAFYRSTLVDLERAERSFRIERDRVALDVRDAIRTIERARLTLQLQIENVTLAENRLEGIRFRKQIGEVQNRRVIEAEEDLLEARNRRDQARADLQTSVLNYLLQTGQMRVDTDGRWLAPGTLVSPESEPESASEPGNENESESEPRPDIADTIE